MEILHKLSQAGWEEIILLDLARVGTRSGIEREFLTEARGTFPELTLLVGGGVRDISDLVDLQTIGINGALIATALHQGTIRREQIRSLIPG